MDNRDGDEGYISPLGDAVVSQSSSIPESSNLATGHHRHGRSSAITWDDAWRLSNGLQAISKPRFFTSAKGGAGSNIIDNLWKVSLEMKQVAAAEAKGINITSPKNEIERMYNMGLLPTYVTMTEFIRDTVDMLTGKRSRTFSYGSKKQFLKNPSILVHGLTPTALAKFSSEFTETGDAVLQLSQVEEMFNFHLLVEAYTFHVCVQFINFIKDYLTVFETAVMIKRTSLQTLVQVKQFFRPFKKQIAVLWAIADGQKFLSPSLLLKNLNECMLKNEEGCVSDLLRMLLRSCASAYTKYVSNWIFKGNLPKTLEFFISEHRSKLVEDRRLWTHRFSQTDDVPHYLMDLKQKIFDTGKKFVLLRQFKSNDLPRCFDELEVGNVELLSTHEDILELMQTYGSKWEAFQEEYGYLVREVQEAILVLSDPTKSCSEEVRKEAHETFEERYRKYQEELMVNRAQEKERKRSVLQDLMVQVSEARHRRLQDALDEVFLLDRVSKEKTSLEAKSNERGLKLLEEYYGDLFFDIIESLEKPEEMYQEASLAEALVPKTYRELCADGNGDGFHVATDDINNQKEILPELVPPADNDTQENLMTQPNAECSIGDGPVMFTDHSPEIDQKPAPVTMNVPQEKLFFVDWSMFEKPLIPSPEEELMIEDEEGQEEFLTNRLLALSVEIPLLHQHKILDICIIHHLVKEHYLYDHLRFIHDCLLMQNGLLVQALVSSLLDLVDEGIKTKEQLMGRMWTLNNQLEKALSNVGSGNLAHIRDSLVVALRDEPETGSPAKRHQAIVSGYEVLNLVVLNYHVGWPVNIVLTTDMLQRFQEVSTLQIRLKRTELLLAKAYTHFKTQATKSKEDSQLNSYRHGMLHFVHSLQNYINVNVIHSSWPDIIQDLSKADSFEDIHGSVVTFLKQIVSNCLLGAKAKPVIKLIYEQLNIIESFCVKLIAWSDSSESVTNEKLRKREHKMLVRLYLAFMEIQKVFVGVVRTVSRKGYYPKVAYFLDVFNFNNFY